MQAGCPVALVMHMFSVRGVDGWRRWLGQSLPGRDVAAELDHQNRRLRNVKLASMRIDDDPVIPYGHQLACLSHFCPIVRPRRDRGGGVRSHPESVPAEIDEAVPADLRLNRRRLAGCVGTARQCRQEQQERCTESHESVLVWE